MEIITPQFDRTDGKTIRWFPKCAADLDALKTASKAELREKGLGPWGEIPDPEAPAPLARADVRAAMADGRPLAGDIADALGGRAATVGEVCSLLGIGEPDTGTKSTERGMLWLFPFEWYDHIPDGYMVTTISEHVEPFKRGETDNDKRFGCLAYGIVAAKE